jgi:hypothetical protein
MDRSECDRHRLERRTVVDPLEHGRAAQEPANALDAPAQNALTIDSPTHEPIGNAILREARALENSNFRRPQWKERGLGRGHDGMVRRHPGR